MILSQHFFSQNQSLISPVLDATQLETRRGKLTDFYDEARAHKVTMEDIDAANEEDVASAVPSTGASEAKYVRLLARVRAVDAGDSVLPAFALSHGRAAVLQSGSEQLAKERRQLAELEANWRTEAAKAEALVLGTHTIFESEVRQLEFNISAAVGMLMFLNYTAYKVVGQRKLEKIRMKQLAALRKTCACPLHAALGVRGCWETLKGGRGISRRIPQFPGSTFTYDAPVARTCAPCVQAHVSRH